MSKLTGYLKNIFIIILILNFAPPIIYNIYNNYSKFTENRTKVGVLEVKGVLYNSHKIVKNLRKFFENKDIKAILLKIDSPGGASGTSQVIYNEILQLKQQNGAKPVIALVENICASGGYYVASAADYIICSPSSMVGSIGVYIAHPQFKEFVEQFKIKYNVTKTGLYKTAGDPMTELTEPAKEMFQALTNDVYSQFVNDIKLRRPKLSALDENLWAQGKILTGNEAFKLGLIDEIGSYSNAVKAVKDKAIIEGEIEWVKPPKKSNIWKLLIGNDDDGSGQSRSSKTLGIIGDKIISGLADKLVNYNSDASSPHCTL